MKVRCDNHRCTWHGQDSEQLSAVNPFDAGDKIYACPECKEIGSVVVACDEPDCWRAVSCGTPTLTGYRTTCGEHRPKEQKT